MNHSLVSPTRLRSVLAWALCASLSACCDPIGAVGDQASVGATVDVGALPPDSLYQLNRPWTDQDRNPHPLSNAAGEWVLTSMIFTHCEFACPRILVDLKGIRSALPETLRDQIQMLVVSMDAERDTPDVLKAYAQANALAPEHWTLLHGDADAVRDFAAATGIRYKRGPKGNYAHSNRITLLDPRGRAIAHWDGLGVDAAAAAAQIQEHLAQDVSQ